ncbi:ATP-binding protein [Rarobacter faecitabidus]|uniref:Signal transduction histidine-protein kinase/phosphatase MprB n=1 Tax=Rarobacter faecitabidus TaxID=13243 RepID=A0A542ZU64_RARFA|nr:ATP-binding protein [Rarobacter faecitabidus]TQL63867.1 signal transduction histidine kinase [Rarobacter faecitabidus]
MRQRVLLATIASVVVTVILLGVPLALFGGRMVSDVEQRRLEVRAEEIGRVVDGRIGLGETVDSDLLDGFAAGSSGQLAISVVVVTATGDQISGGTAISGRTIETALRTDSNTIVVIATSYWDVFWRSFQVVLVVAALSLAALLIGLGWAVWQANRLSAPLVYLAASAELLGSGQVRPRIEPSGVEEIDLVAQELSRSADRLASRLAVERQFSSDVSHQLRTPLTALAMRLEEIMLASDDDYVRDEARKSLEQVERLAGVVEDLRQRARQTTGGTTEPVALREVVDQQRDEWLASFEAQERDIRIEVDSDVQVLATPGALAQVLATLIENSLKHGSGLTTVSATAGRGSGAVVISVADEGMGVPEEIVPRVFEREVSSGKGSGLGLGLARDLVAADGGRLELSQRAPAIFSIFLAGVPRVLDPDEVLPTGGSSRVRKPRGRKKPEQD